MTYVFDLVTEASPQTVWAVLTTPELTAQYLSGLAARSTWRAGASVTLEPGGQLELSGAPLENIHQICLEMSGHLAELRDMASRRNTRA